MTTPVFKTKPAAWFPWIIVAAGFLTYSNSFSCSFLFDDAVVITNNPHIYHLWPPWLAVLSPARFLADYSFAVNHLWAGSSPADYRLINIIIHLSAGLLLFGIVRRTLLLPRWEGRYSSTAPALAFSIALLWTLHPLQTESVTYIAQRIEALMGLFFLLTLTCFIRGVAEAGSKKWFFAALIACVLGMGTKEVMATAPPLILLYDAILVSSSWKEPFIKRWKIHAALFSTWILLAALVGLAVARAHAENVTLFSSETIRWKYALTQLNVLAHYIRLAIIPYPLCLDYQWPLVTSVRAVIWPGGLIVLLGLGTVWALWRRTWLGFIGAWFFMILAPTSSFNPLPDAAFEHRMYLPLAAVLMVLVMGVYKMMQRKAAWVLGFACLGLTGLALGALSYQRNKAYLSEETMWRDVIHKCPDNLRSYISLSSALMVEERYVEAQDICRIFLTRCPDFSKMTYEVIANRFAQPGAPAVLMYYSMVHNNLGLIALNLNHSGEAKQHYLEALRVYPSGVWAHRNLGNLLYNEQHLDNAITEWQLAIECQPRDYKTHESLGVAFSQKRQFEEAVRSYEKAIKIKPDLWFSRAQLAWILATCPVDTIRNGVQALETAIPLLAASHGQSARAYDILAAAYAETGNYSNAVTLAAQALSLLETNRMSVDHDAILQRREIYRSGRPYRDN